MPSTAIDITGLPEELVRDLERLVRSLRTRLAGPGAAAANGTTPPEAKPTAVELQEFDRALDELALGSEELPPLPHDFSRADIYDEHD